MAKKITHKWLSLSKQAMARINKDLKGDEVFDTSWVREQGEQVQAETEGMPFLGVYEGDYPLEIKSTSTKKEEKKEEKKVEPPKLTVKRESIDGPYPRGGWAVYMSTIKVCIGTDVIARADVTSYAGNCSIVILSSFATIGSSNFTQIQQLRAIIDAIESGELKLSGLVNNIPSIIEYTTVESRFNLLLQVGFNPIYSYRNYTSGNTITKFIYPLNMERVSSASDPEFLSFRTNFNLENKK